MEDTQNTLRDALTASFDAIEAGAPSPEPVEQKAVEPAERPRDEQGKFAPKDATQQNPEPAPQEPQAKPRPSTWRKEYYPIWDKLTLGQPLSAEESAKLAAYTEERESQYKTGVSTYKAEAEQAKELRQALEPFMAEMQQYNIQPKDWITNLGNAHRVLAGGSPEQKLAMFTKLAQDYGIPLNHVATMQQGGQVDPYTLQLLQELQDLKSQVASVSGWREQLEEKELVSEISKYSEDKENYPHFKLVRSQMAQLLETGKASDLKEAYEIAARPIEDLIEQRLAQVRSVSSPAQAVSAAKAKAVSPRSASPSGTVAAATNAKDRRSILAEQVEAALGGGRV